MRNWLVVGNERGDKRVGGSGGRIPKRFRDVRCVEGLREKRGHRNTRGGREQTKPKINALHLLGQFAPSVGPRPALYTSGVDLFQGGVLAARSLSLSLSLSLSVFCNSHPWEDSPADRSPPRSPGNRGTIRLAEIDGHVEDVGKAVDVAIVRKIYGKFNSFDELLWVKSYVWRY